MKLSTFILFFAAFAICFPALPAQAQTNPGYALSDTFSDELVQGILTVENQNGQVLYTENDLATYSGLPQSLVTMMAADPDLNLSPYATANLSTMIGPLDSDFGYVWDGNSGANNGTTFVTSVAGWLPNRPPSQLLSTNGTLESGTFTNPDIFNAVTADLINNGPFGATVVSNTVQDDVGDDVFNLDHQNDPVFPYVASDVVFYDTDTIVVKEAGIVPEASSMLLLLAGLAGVGLFAWTRQRKAVRQ